MQSKHRDGLLRKIGTKYGKNCYLDVPDKPRREAAAAFHLFNGYYCFAAYLCRIGIFSEAGCALCDKNDDTMDNHLLRFCGASLLYIGRSEDSWGDNLLVISRTF